MKIIFLLAYPFLVLASLSPADLEMRWTSTYQIVVNKKLKQGESIRKPVGAVIVLADLYLLTKNSLAVKDCLIYRVPNSDHPGRLSVITIKLKESCQKNRFKKTIFKHKNIFNLSFQRKLESFNLAIDKEVWKFPLYNIKIDKKTSSPSSYSYKIPGVKVSFIDDFREEKPLEEFDICKDVPDQCGAKTTDLCHMCPSGESYSVVASSCADSLRKYCGSKTCGEKNQPACIRGRAATDYRGDFCLPDSPMGICVKPNRVSCLNEELYCR